MELPTLTDLAAGADRMAPALLDVGLRGVVILGLAGVATLGMRRASAAARHWVWLLAFAGLLLLPVFAAVMPGWRVLPRLTANETAKRAASPDTQIIIMPPTAAASLENSLAAQAPPTNGPDGSTGVAVVGPAAVSTASPTGASVPASPPEQPAELHRAAGNTTTPARVASPSIAASAEPARTAAGLPLTWTFWLVALWLVGTLAVLGQVVLGFLSLLSLKRRCGALGRGEWAALLGQLCRTLNIQRRVELLSSPQRTMPMTWGLVRTCILLPEHAAEWPEEQRRAVLLHELGHVRRWDCVTQMIAQVACAAYWFNPLVWVAWRRMQVERERACDDLVLTTGARASTYARHLLHTAAAQPALRFVGAAVAMARPSTLEERLRAILDPNRRRGTLSRRAGMGAVVLLFAALTPIAVLQGQVGGTAGGASVAPAAAGGSSTLPTAETIQGRLAERRTEQLALQGVGVAGQAPSNATCALDATIYDVRIPLDKLSQVDAAGLSKAAGDAAGFEKALAELGTAVPLYRATQSVRLAGDTISINTQTPYITNSQMTAEGKTINSVSYRDTGATFALAGKVDQAEAMKVNLTVDVSALSDSGTAISTTVTAPIFRSDTLVYKGVVKARQPFVLICVDAASRDQSGKAVAYIARVTLGAPQEN